MNYRIVLRNLGLFSVLCAFWMGVSALWSLWYWEPAALGAFAASIAVALAAGAALMTAGRGAPKRLYERESVAIVGLSWIFLAGLGALPYWFSGMLSMTDAYFESMSGFTTTGSSVIAVLEPVSKGILFWRHLSHWLGGIGIVVLMVAIVPFMGSGSKMLYRSEVTGLDKQGVRPRVRESAFTLLKIYVGLTVVFTAFLMAAGMNLHEALCHAFASLATGGFSTRTASIAAFDSVTIEVMIILFQFLGATNFTLYYLMAKGNWRAIFKDSEWRTYIVLYITITSLVVINLLGVQGTMQGDQYSPGAKGGVSYGFSQALRYASFEVGTMITNTGFAVTNFDIWPYFSRILIMAFVITGGCAGSTAGGMKIIRVMILAKIAASQIKRTFRPHTVHAIRVNDRVVTDDVQYAVLTFFMIYVLVMAFSTLLLSWIGLPLQTAFSATVACLNNTGPGLEYVGAAANFCAVPALGKWFLCLVMIVGRLEFFSILVFLFPSFWRR